MYLITDKKSNYIMGFGNELIYQSNGYPKIVDTGITFLIDDIFVYEIDIIPKHIVTDMYCYTPSKRFYLNPNWKEPNKYGIANELMEDIQADYTAELITQGVI